MHAREKGVSRLLNGDAPLRKRKRHRHCGTLTGDAAPSAWTV